MSNAVIITLIICATLIALSLINKKRNRRQNHGKKRKSRGGG